MKKVPIYYILLSILGSGAISYFIACNITKKHYSEEIPVAASMTPAAVNNVSEPCSYNIDRLSGYKFVRPLLYTEQECESPKLNPLKNNIEKYIDDNVKNGVLATASVYVKLLNHSEWTVVNPKESFHPASMLKVVEMIALLKMSERQPGFLDKKVLFTNETKGFPVQIFPSQTIQSGHKYTIRELIHSMIAYSDNFAQVELVKYLDMNAFKKTFTDIGLAAPGMYDLDYKLSAKDYSVFPEILYNVGYLTMSNSEFATSLLAQSTFREGIVKNLPSSLQVTHKFGEWGDNKICELHESGIVYMAGNPYLITVMTRGKDIHKLTGVLADISKMAFDEIGSSNQNARAVAANFPKQQKN